MKRYIKFNELEWAIFDHRYNLIDDALGECLESSIAGDPDYAHWPKDWRGAMSISEHFYNTKTKKTKSRVPLSWGNKKPWGNWVVRMDVTNLNEIDRWVIDDSVDGSTLFADHDEFVAEYRDWVDSGKPVGGDGRFNFRWSPKEFRQAARSIERKLKRVGSDVKFDGV
jgi:hypothetical protein